MTQRTHMDFNLSVRLSRNLYQQALNETKSMGYDQKLNPFVNQNSKKIEQARTENRLNSKWHTQVQYYVESVSVCANCQNWDSFGHKVRGKKSHTDKAEKK